MRNPAPQTPSPLTPSANTERLSRELRASHASARRGGRWAPRTRTRGDSNTQASCCYGPLTRMTHGAVRKRAEVCVKSGWKHICKHGWAPSERAPRPPRPPARTERPLRTAARGACSETDWCRTTPPSCCAVSRGGADGPSIDSRAERCGLLRRRCAVHGPSVLALRQHEYARCGCNAVGHLGLGCLRHPRDRRRAVPCGGRRGLLPRELRVRGEWDA